MTEAYAHLLKRTPAQARSRLRVEAILDAAADLLAEVEPADVTVRDLAERAGVPTGTLYQFFADLEAVLQALALRFLAAMPAVLADALAGPGPWEATVARVVEAYAAMVRTHPAIRRLWLSGVLDTATRQAERETDSLLAAGLGARLQAQAGSTGGSTGGSAAQWEVLVAQIDALLRLAFTRDPAGDQTILVEATRAATAYAGAVLATP